MSSPRMPCAKRMEHVQQMIAYDRGFEGFGVSLAGMDEVGRGPLFGPVMAACVIMPETPVFYWMDDSKKLSCARREELFEEITQHALYIGVGEASALEIEEHNILGATRLAMERAAMNAPATLCLVDAVRGLRLPFPTHSLDKGDSTSYQVAAASIIAKVIRDQRMAVYAEQYPGYGLERNKGYGTAEHIQAIGRLGATPEHRSSFIKKFLKEA